MQRTNGLRIPLAWTTLGLLMNLGLAEASAGFHVVKSIPVPENPHGIEFSRNGSELFLISSRGEALTVLSYTTDEIVRRFELPDTPLGIVLLPDGRRAAVSHFGSDRISLVDLDSGGIEKTIRVGPRPSLFTTSSDGRRAFVACEGEDRIYEVSLAPFEIVGWFETGRRPFPSSLSPDDRWLFVPGYDSSDVTVIDLLMRRVDDTIEVGENPSGGSVMPGGKHYAVVNRGSNRIDFIDIVTHGVDWSLREGLSEEPFSLVLSPNGRLGFINNSRSANVSVLDVENRSVIARIDVGSRPIVMAVHPWGRKLYVSCEGSNELVIVAIPDAWAKDNPIFEESQGGALHDLRLFAFTCGWCVCPSESPDQR